MLCVAAAVISGPYVSPQRAAAAETYAIDPDRSVIEFRIRHVGITFWRGVFPKAQGSYTFDHESPERASIRMAVKVAAVDTGNKRRDAHLRSPDFFDEAAFPTIFFYSRSIKALDGGRYVVEGDLTLHGVTGTVSVVAVKTALPPDRSAGDRSGFEARFSIRRSDYGMDYLASVADRVELLVRVEGVRVERQAEEGTAFGEQVPGVAEPLSPRDSEDLKVRR